MSSEILVRELEPDELPQRYELSRLAFGGPAEAPPSALEVRADRIRYGAFDGRGHLLGTATDVFHHRWWDGEARPVADVGGVAVAPEARGRGVARALLGHLLAGARGRGAGLSFLYPTVSALYRSAGWAMVGARRSIDIPTALLADARSRAPLALRQGTAADLAGLSTLRSAVGRLRNGILIPTQGTEAADSFPEGIDGVSIATDDGGDAGFVAWGRGSGYHEDAVLTVAEIMARNPEAATSLLALLSSWRSVAPTVRFIAVPSGLLSHVLPLEVAREHRTSRFMGRVVDLASLVRARHWPAALTGGCTIEVEDRLASWNHGRFELAVDGGRGELSPTTRAPQVTASVNGLASLACGTATPEMLAEAGLASLHDPAAAGLLRQLMVGPPVELLDYF
ncbi:MAG: GNAT family N-acetyltransferase [Actinomycetota bacterium]|nr:GNAT family N-acetyltransferase [Actinomycetota bacterium]